ncbi:hypothetical protein MMC22_003951 [Lobaria immixta]|nr:hypothetical protein [Lobaria immixta]
MHAPSTIFLTSLLAFFSTTVSAAPSCIVPQIAFETLDKPFTLTAIAPKSDWWVLLKTPSATKETQPYISHTRIAPPQFRLTGGNLTTVGDNGKKFPAHFGPTIAIFPPVLQPILFGGDSEADSRYFAGYACDSQGKSYLQLRNSERTDVVLSLKINEQ